MLLHTGLDDAQLGPRLARLLAPSSPLPAREMVARGLAPLAGAEPWLALYQLWVRGGATLADQASRTAGELPGAAVMTALADPFLPTVVLDFMARRRIRSPETLRLIVHHPRVHDATLQALARCAPEGVCGALAKNQRRWLVCPAIAEQLVRNSCCDRATAHAVLELGAREALPALAELRRLALSGAVLQDSPEAHARAIAWMLRSGPGEPCPDLSAAALPAPVLAARRPATPDADGPGPPAPAGGSSRPGPGAAGLSLRTDAAAPGRPPRADATGLSFRPASSAAPPRPAPGRARTLSFRAEPALDELDELDLPIADDWDELVDPADVPPPALRESVALPGLPVAPPSGESVPPVARDATPAAAPACPGPRPAPRSYADRVELVLNPSTPLPLAMSELHRLRAPDLRRVAAARRLSPALVAAARRRAGTP